MTWTTCVALSAWSRSTCSASRTAACWRSPTPPHIRTGFGALVVAAGLAAFTDDLQADADRMIASRSHEPWHADAVAALAEEEAGSYTDMASLWLRMAPLYFARWDESYRAPLEAGAVGSRVEPGKAFNSAPGDVRPQLAQITAPTLVVAGSDDFICGPVAANDIAHGIAGSELVMIENAGHMLFMERPDEFRSAIERFLSAGAGA